MDPEISAAASQSPHTKVIRKQIGDLHLSLRQAEDWAMFPSIGDDRLQQLIDQTVVGIFRSTVDGKLVMANTAMARIFGYESPEDILQSITDIGSQIYVDSHRRQEAARIPGMLSWHSA